MIHQRPTDTLCFKPHIERLKNTSLPFPKNIIADAGYGGEENYLYSLEEEFEALIPYNKKMNKTVQITVRFYLNSTRPVRIRMASHVILKFMNARIVRITH